MKPTSSVLVLSAILVSPAARAHISLEQGGTHESRYGEAQIKDAPCGMADGGPGSKRYTYQAGETIEVSLVETIPHPGYFRIAFDDDGDDDFVEPQTIEPLDPNRPCPFNAADRCGPGMGDYYNNETVLPGMDKLDPHITVPADPKYTWSVKLPDVACDNCTLQIIQVMQDTIHGAYNTERGNPADVPFYIEDNYHQCIDLELVKADEPAGEPGEEGGGDDGGGCTVAAGGARSSSAPLATVVAGLALIAARRLARRRA